MRVLLCMRLAIHCYNYSKNTIRVANIVFCRILTKLNTICVLYRAKLVEKRRLAHYSCFIKVFKYCFISAEIR